MPYIIIQRYLLFTYFLSDKMKGVTT
jgi:hypothetical protein